MRTPRHNWNNGTSRRLGFTFIELVVAIALTVILIRGMYTVFFAATDLARVSEEKMGAILEATAVCDTINVDVARSPYSSTDYFLSIGNDPTSVTFQAARLDGSPGSFVYIGYSLSGTTLTRTVWKDSGKSAVATLAENGEDGSMCVVGRKIASFQVWYLDDSASDVNDDASWVKTPSLSGTSRTRALKFVIQIQSEGTILPDQIFTSITPIMYN